MASSSSTLSPLQTDLTLSWVLSRVELAESAAVPAGMTLAEVDTFRKELIARFSRLALPNK